MRLSHYRYVRSLYVRLVKTVQIWNTRKSVEYTSRIYNHLTVSELERALTLQAFADNARAPYVPVGPRYSHQSSF